MGPTRFLCVGVVLALIGHGDTTPGHVLLAKTIYQSLLPRFVEELRLSGGLVDGDIKPRGTLLPPNIPDPDCFGPGFIPINLTIPDPLIRIYGEVGVTSETKAYGFSRIHDDFNLTYIALTGAARVAWDFGIPDIRLDGNYRMNLTIDLGTTKEALGEGPLTGTVDTVFLKLRANASIPLVGKIRFTGLDLDLGFSNFDLDGGDEATIGGLPINWTRASENLQIYFDTNWNDETRPLVNEMIRCSLDHLINVRFLKNSMEFMFTSKDYEAIDHYFAQILQNCTLADLTGGNINECLNMEPNPACYFLSSKPSSVIEIDNFDAVLKFFEPSVVCLEDITTIPTTSAPPATTTATPVTSTATPDTTPSAGHLHLAFSFFSILTTNMVVALFHPLVL